MNFDRSDTIGLSTDYLRQRKYEQVKEALQWIAKFERLTENLIDNLADACSEVARMDLWTRPDLQVIDNEVQEPPPLKLINKSNIRHLKCAEIRTSLITPETMTVSSSPPGQGLSPSGITSWLGSSSGQTTSPTKAISDVDPSFLLFYRRSEALIDATSSYNHSVEYCAVALEGIAKRHDFSIEQFKKTLTPHMERITKEIAEVKEVISSFLVGSQNSNARHTDADIAVRGPSDVRISILFDEIDTSPFESADNSKVVPCLWIQYRALQVRAKSINLACQAFLESLERTLKESYAISSWNVIQKTKVVTLALSHHNQHYEHLLNIERHFSRQIKAGEVDENPLSMKPFEKPWIESSITVAYVQLQSRLTAFKESSDAMKALEDLSQLYLNENNSSSVAMTVVRNAMPALMTLDSTPVEVPLGTPLLLQITADRFIHLFRSHQDTQPLRSVYALEVQPSTSKGPASTPANGASASREFGLLETVELNPTSSVGDSYFKTLFKKVPGSNKKSIAVQFSSETENKQWKRLLRYTIVEQDVAFCTYSETLANTPAVDTESSPSSTSPVPAIPDVTGPAPLRPLGSFGESIFNSNGNFDFRIDLTPEPRDGTPQTSVTADDSVFDLFVPTAIVDEGDVSMTDVHGKVSIDTVTETF